MMNHKFVAFVYSDDANMLTYIENQLIAIKNAFPDVDTQLANETDVRITLHSTKTNRFPVFMIFEHNILKAKLYGKFNIDELTAWIDRNLR